MSIYNPPFLRWAGSKRKQVPKLSQYWMSDFNAYIEPFMGSACLFFALNPQRSVLSDINPELVNVYKAIKNNPNRVFKYLKDYPVSKSFYYYLRDKRLDISSSYESAARFIYLNRFCFNGLYRTNKQGKFNVPYSPSKSGKLPELESLKRISRQLSETQIYCDDFENVLLSSAKRRDFVFLDPPYAVSDRRVFTEYGPRAFDSTDLERLKHCLDVLDKRGSSFVLTYAYTNETKDVFRKWNQKRSITQRNIAGFTSSRRKSAELIVTNIEIKK